MSCRLQLQLAHYLKIRQSYRDNSNKWSNIGFIEEITQVESIEDNLMNLIWSSAFLQDDVPASQSMTQVQKAVANMDKGEQERKIDEVVKYILVADQKKVPIKKQGTTEIQICVNSTYIGTTYVISSPYPMFCHMLELPQRDYSKWLNIGCGEEI